MSENTQQPENIENQVENEEEIVEEEEPIDPEILKAILKANENPVDYLMKGKEEKKPSKLKKVPVVQKKLQVLKLNEFNEKIDNQIEANKPKKFISQRVKDKKDVQGIKEELIVKRQFNARKEPYNFVYKKTEKIFVDVMNNEEFPTFEKVH